MWCTQSKPNFTGYEFAWDAVYLVEPGLGYACRMGVCCCNQADILGYSYSRQSYWWQFLPCLLGVDRGAESWDWGIAQMLQVEEMEISLSILKTRRQVLCYRSLVFATRCVTHTVPSAIIYLMVFGRWASLSETERCQISRPRSEFMV